MMYLLQCNRDGKFSLAKYLDENVPPYAILSHTWGLDNEEVTFKDMMDGTGQSKSGYDKIRFCGRQAVQDGLQNFWVDTCCIDKSNNNELSEAINSMFRWYRNAAKCYVLLSDVSKRAFDTDQQSWESAFRNCRWFTRGWTLQELIAPTSVNFFSKDWDYIGNKASLERQICDVTGIPVTVLQGAPLANFTVTERMSWAEKRETIRKEDSAYSLLGIFDVYIPLIYGEGRGNAFRRLREEIDKVSISNSTKSLEHYSTVPNRQVAPFIPREDILSRLHVAFAATSGVTRIATLVGMGGQGKTQVALEFCRQIRQSYSACFWANASSETFIKESFGTISDLIKPDSYVLTDLEAKVNYAIGALRKWQHPWLLVLDNHDDPTSFNIQDYIPINEHGRVLVTSRHADVKALTDDKNAFEMLGMTEAEAIKLLLVRSKAKNVDYARLIVKRLGYHPLAIDQAGSYINKCRLDLGDFLNLYESRKKQVLQFTPSMSRYRRKLNPYEQETCLTVFSTSELSFQQLMTHEDEGHPKSSILSFFAFFSCTPFTERVFKTYWQRRGCWPCKKLEELIRDCFTAPDGSWDSGLFANLVSELADLSLIESFGRSPDGCYFLTLHPLIQDWLGLRITKSSCSEYSFQASVVLFCLLSDPREYFEVVKSFDRELLPHLAKHNENCQHLLGSGLLNSIQDTSLWLRMTFNFAQLQNIVGQYTLSENTVSEGLRVIEQDPTELLSQRTAVKSQLVYSLHLQGRPARARDICIEILDDLKAKNQERSADSIFTWQDLAWSLLEHGDPHGAELIYRDLLTLESSNEYTFKQKLQTINGLSIALRDQGKFSESESMMRDIIYSIKRELGEDYPDLVPVYQFNLGSILIKRDDKFGEAENIFRQILKCEKLRLGENHPDVLWNSSMLAETLVEQDKVDEAETLIVPTLSILETTLPPNHFIVLDSGIVHAKILIRRRRFEEARTRTEKVLERLLQVVSPTHWRVVRAKLMIAQLTPLPDK